MIDWISKLDIATAVMIIILIMGGWVLWKVQKDPNNDFDFEDMMRDDTGKPSSFRLAVFISLAVSTWVIMYIVLKTNSIDSWIFVAYLGIWSGAKVAESAIQAYGGYKSGNSARTWDSETHSHSINDRIDQDNIGEGSSNIKRRYTPPRRRY